MRGFFIERTSHSHEWVSFRLKLAVSQSKAVRHGEYSRCGKYAWPNETDFTSVKFTMDASTSSIKAKSQRMLTLAFRVLMESCYPINKISRAFDAVAVLLTTHRNSL